MSNEKTYVSPEGLAYVYTKLKSYADSIVIAKEEEIQAYIDSAIQAALSNIQNAEEAEF